MAPVRTNRTYSASNQLGLRHSHENDSATHLHTGPPTQKVADEFVCGLCSNSGNKRPHWPVACHVSINLRERRRPLQIFKASDWTTLHGRTCMSIGLGEILQSLRYVHSLAFSFSLRHFTLSNGCSLSRFSASLRLCSAVCSPSIYSEGLSLALPRLLARANIRMSGLPAPRIP